jgi:hypothetical protein
MDSKSKICCLIMNVATLRRGCVLFSYVVWSRVDDVIQYNAVHCTTLPIHAMKHAQHGIGLSLILAFVAAAVVDDDVESMD